MPGLIIVVLPTIGWSWPAVLPILTAAAAGLGYKKLTETGSKGWLRGRLNKKLENIRRVTISLDEVLTEVISEDIGNEERISFQRDDILLVFRKDARGKFYIDVSGPKTQTALNMKIRGEEFARELIQKFAYHKMIEQMQQRNAVVVEETETENGDLVIKTRQWM